MHKKYLILDIVLTVHKNDHPIESVPFWMTSLIKYLSVV